MLTEISTVNETSRSKSDDTVNTDYRVAVSKLDTAVLYRITAIAFRHRVRMAIAISSTIVASVFQLYIPQYLGLAVDHMSLRRKDNRMLGFSLTASAGKETACNH